MVLRWHLITIQSNCFRLVRTARILFRHVRCGQQRRVSLLRTTELFSRVAFERCIHCRKRRRFGSVQALGATRSPARTFSVQPLAARFFVRTERTRSEQRCCKDFQRALTRFVWCCIGYATTISMFCLARVETPQNFDRKPCFAQATASGI
jgi:hypothetical protein